MQAIIYVSVLGLYCSCNCQNFGFLQIIFAETLCMLVLLSFGEILCSEPVIAE